MASSFFSEESFGSVILQALGEDEDAIYVPEDENTDYFTLNRFKFNEHHVTLEFDEVDGREYETVGPKAWILESQCPKDPHFDEIHFKGKKYKIISAERDGHGFVGLTLEKGRDIDV